MSLDLELFVFLALFACERIDLVEHVGCKFRNFSFFEIFLKAVPSRISFFEFSYNETYLKTPVTEMYVRNNVVSAFACKTLE